MFKETENGQNIYTVNVESKVTFRDWFGLHPFQIDATFDFSKIPKGLHQPFFIRLCNEYNKNHQGIVHNSSKNSQGWLGKIFNYKFFKRT